MNVNGSANGQVTKCMTAADLNQQRQNAPPPSTPLAIQKHKDMNSPEYKKEQALNTGPLMYLTYENASHYGAGESTFTALHDIFQTLNKSSSRAGVLYPQRFLEIFKKENEMFRSAMHQDAHEFFGLVLNSVIQYFEDQSLRMRDIDMKNAMAIQEGNGVAHEVMSALTTAAVAMGIQDTGQSTPSTQWVHDIFEGVLTSETKCLTCETASQRDEKFLDLSIDLEEHSSVTSCLRKFSAEEMLCERNKFHCDHCGGLQEAEKRMKIKRLPKILTLHLKRFKYTEDMTRLQKLFHRVVYPYHLRMFNTTDDAEDPDRLYELYAVVVHIGGNAYQGHYVTIIKTPDFGWLLFDDEMVEPVDKNYVKNFFGDKPGMACAYVLFYQETTLEAVQKEQEAEGLEDVEMAVKEADVSAGHPYPNGTVPGGVKEAMKGEPLVHTASLPVRLVGEELPGLDYATTSPSLPTGPLPFVVPGLSHSEVPPKPPTKDSVYGTSPAMTPSHASKEEKERMKKEAKEAEKLKKAAEKERIKAEDKTRKEAFQKQKEAARRQTEDMKAAVAASRKQAEENERMRNAERTPVQGKENHGVAESIRGGGGWLSNLGRAKTGSRSVSGKKGVLGEWLSKKNADGGRVVEENNWEDTNTPPLVPEIPPAVLNAEGEDKVGRPPVTPSRSATTDTPGSGSRFSFGLGRKKSNIVGP